MPGSDERHAAVNRNSKLETVYRLFRWLNRVNETGEDMNIAAIRSIFAPEAPMTLNGKTICHDHETHFRHALDLQTQMEHWRFNIPFDHVVIEGDQVVGYYTVDYETKSGRKGRMLDFCVFTVRDDKIAGILEVVHFEGEGLDIETFG